MGPEIRADVCVIGAGPAGITVATELARAGVEVLLLESGADDPESSDQDSNIGVSIGHPYYLLHEARHRAVGGSSHCWLSDVGLRARPLDHIDLSMRDGIQYSGWPIEIEQLYPYYKQAQEICGLGPFRYEPTEWDDLPPPLLRESSTLDNILFQFGPTDTFVRKARELPATVSLFTNATVAALIIDDLEGEVVGADIRRSNGDSLMAVADTYVLAAGGIENARILLNSPGPSDDGLGNRMDLVGRFFMEHLRVRGGWMEWRSNAQALDFYTRFSREGTVLGGMLRPSAAWTRSSQLANCALFLNSSPAYTLEPAYRAGSTGLAALLGTSDVPVDSRRYLVQAVKSPVRLAGAIVGRALGMGPLASDAIEIGLMSEQVPNPDSRITLSGEVDHLGIPRVVLDWKLSAVDLRSMMESERLLMDEMYQAGIANPVVSAMARDSRPIIRGNWHHIGTTRMSADPEGGVVDANCRLHDVSNLYVAGSSVFPTGGYANPTLTIVALALRLADHLKTDRR